MVIPTETIIGVLIIYSIVVSGILFSLFVAAVLRTNASPHERAAPPVGMLGSPGSNQMVEVQFMAVVVDLPDGGHQIRVSGRMDDAEHVAAYLASIAIRESDEGIEMTLQKITDEAMEMARNDRQGGE